MHPLFAHNSSSARIETATVQAIVRGARRFGMKIECRTTPVAEPDPRAASANLTLAPEGLTRASQSGALSDDPDEERTSRAMLIVSAHKQRCMATVTILKTTIDKFLEAGTRRSATPIAARRRSSPPHYSPTGRHAAAPIAATSQPERAMNEAPFRNGYHRLTEAMHEWGVSVCFGVNGGGIIHLLKHFAPYRHRERDGDSIEFFSVNEYVAGFMPLGHYLSSGRIAAAAATTGAATKLLLCGLSDAKLHNLPALYLVAATPARLRDRAPLQDTTESGANIAAQIAAELPRGTFVIDDLTRLDAQLAAAAAELSHNAPVALVLPSDVLAAPMPAQVPATPAAVPACPHLPARTVLERYLTPRPRGRTLVLVGDEAHAVPDIAALTTRLCAALDAPAVWSINGANAVAHDNPHAVGYLGFGGSAAAARLWRDLGPDDTLVSVGYCADEYTVNFAAPGAGVVWNLAERVPGYGSLDGGFAHLVPGRFVQTVAPLRETVATIVDWSPSRLHRGPAPPTHRIAPPRTPRADAQCVDLIDFYRRLDTLWRPDSIGFDDVCMAYKDRQHVLGLPHPHIRFYSLYRGSAMGGAYGAALGAKAADPRRHVFAFSGDGCFRLYGGALTEARDMGIALFVLDNGSYGLVEQVLEGVLPNTQRERYHARLPRADYAGIAAACGWNGYRLNPDLSNLEELMERAYLPGRRSLLIQVPVDAAQVLGDNPRAANL
ncbi:thiamine pyrophosphate-binding protein [Lysobacter sp. K5869]|uniref:thiamine pyrophosphate-dependent enzyme n=1 Tax=Lysobacter sp. K5869 TaxID=2820808 RepID=UPI001C06344D|nr:thiamine pyrophosphate-dependent enzyme [Lysobacter sp. K5869]QWP76217.1 thiamine pyrophosphate-binding protein [Lysobacter sp. K5869]